MTLSETHTAFLHSAFEETLTLLEDVRGYIAANLASGGDLLPAEHATLVRAMSRLTWQLTEVMSWLLLRKAVAVGEIDLDEAREREEFELQSLMDEEDGASDGFGDLPVPARGLIDRCRRICAQAARLE